METPVGMAEDPPSPAPTGGQRVNLRVEVEAITRAMANLDPRNEEAMVPDLSRIYIFDYPRLENELDLLLGLNSSREELHCLYYGFASVVSELIGGGPLHPTGTPCSIVFPYRMHDQAWTYGHLLHRTFGLVEGLPSHLQPFEELLGDTASSTSSSPTGDDDGWQNADFSVLEDPEGLRQFLEASNFELQDFGPDDNDDWDGGYELTWP